MDRVEDCEAAGSDHCFTAASAAITDEVNFVPDILTKLNQITLISGLEQIQALSDINFPGMAVSGEGGGGDIKGHTDILRCFAGPIHMFHFVAAVADPDPPMGGGFNDLRSPLIIQHMESVLL